MLALPARPFVLQGIHRCRLPRCNDKRGDARGSAAVRDARYAFGVLPCNLRADPFLWHLVASTDLLGSSTSVDGSLDLAANHRQASDGSIGRCDRRSGRLSLAHCPRRPHEGHAHGHSTEALAVAGTPFALCYRDHKQVLMSASKKVLSSGILTTFMRAQISIF